MKLLLHSLALAAAALFAGCAATTARNGNETAPVAQAISRAEVRIRTAASDNKAVRALSTGIGRDSKAVIRRVDEIRIGTGTISDKAVKALKIIGDWQRRHPHFHEAP